MFFVLQYALVGYTDVLRDELRDGGIFVGTVNPGKPNYRAIFAFFNTTP